METSFSSPILKEVRMFIVKVLGFSTLIFYSCTSVVKYYTL